ncbi:MAG: protein translocase subunit SecD [Candidatus Dadabacteria bacterium]|nr:protein translocase subunit SecD [Candidatus Dadabacteria bacterium]
MRRASRSWIIVILIAMVLSVIFLTPTLLGDMLPSWWGKVFPRKGLRLGLDLRGGVYLLLGVRAEKAVDQELSSMKDLINEGLAKDKIIPKSFQNSDKTLTINFFSKDDLEKARKLETDYKEIADINENDLSLSFTLKDQYIKELQRRAIDQVKETITNRVDEFGVVEPTIQRAGADRILIQVPGASASDRERIINIIKRAAVLEFKIVKDTGPTQETLLAKYSVGTPDELSLQGLRFHQGDTRQENEKYFVTESDAQVTGQYLSDARLIFDEYGRPAVGFSFRGEGASKFGKLTGDNIGNRLAIVLDGTIKSAPVIQERISSQGRITGSFTLDEAKDLALVLRSGALPVPVDVEQEQTVGPSLGSDSIEKGKLSMIVGGIAVLLFMIVFYKLQGVIADIALALNMFFIMGFLSAFGVTLTLPGIAGLVLTIGMAVDGNIITFERIKEELRIGKSTFAAIDAGYERSLWTVLDSNLTTLLTALILFWFGTGPIKGFAVTLSIGIIFTIFSNVVVARVITNLVYGERKVEALSI